MSLRNLCFGEKDRFNHDDIGWNYRLSNLQAALGCGQLENINWILKRKREITPHKTIYLYLFVFIEIYIFIYLSNKSEAMASIVADNDMPTTTTTELNFPENTIVFH